MSACVILAGGLGTRLRSAVPDLPKCLAPVGRHSFLAMQVGLLKQAGVDDIVLSLGHMADKVVEALATDPLLRGVRHVVEPRPLGTGGAVAFAMDQAGLSEALVTNGDTYLEGDLSAMLAPLRADQNEGFRMAVVTVPDRARFGGVEIGPDDRLLRFLEKGNTGEGPINAGFYRVARGALPAAAGQQAAFSMETDALPALVARQQVIAARIDGEFIDIGIPDDYQRFCAHHAR